MKLITPRLVNLAAKIVGATREDVASQDGELHVPNVLQPIFTLSEPLRRTSMFFAPLSVQRDETFTVTDQIQQIGVNAGGQIINYGILVPGIWRLTFTEDYSFAGTASTGADFLQVVPQTGGVSQYQPLNHWRVVGHVAPAPTILELVLDTPTTLTAVTAATIAGDTLLWSLNLLAQRLF